jgi:hypothetical protein
LGLRHSRLDSLDKLVFQFLSEKKGQSMENEVTIIQVWRHKFPSYRSARDGQFNLPPMRAHKFLEVVTHIFQYSQSIVLGQCIQEVFHCAAFVRTASVLFQLGNNLRLVALGQGWGAKDGWQFVVGFEDLLERGQSFGYRVKCARLCCGGVL